MVTMLRPSRLIHAAARIAAAAVIVAAAQALPLGGLSDPLGPSAVRADATCTGWSSRDTPPATIRVLRTTGDAAGSVAVVPFRDYVNVVMAAEWGPDNPTEALKAGAVAVKEYAWYRAMVWRGKTANDGSCYDVVDSTIDQVYAPETHPPVGALTAVVDATWGITLRKSGLMFPTHYESGADVACAANADGQRLFQVSAMQCAQDGMRALAILDAYYGPGLEILGTSPGDPSPASAVTSSPSPGPSASPALPRPTLTLKADARVVTWGAPVRLTAQLAPPGAMAARARALVLQRSIDGVAWTTVAHLATDAEGAASHVERPATNAYYRTAFDGARDLGPAASPAVRVLVRRLALLQPGDGSTAVHVPRGTAVTFTTLVRPVHGSIAPGPVAYRLSRLVGGAWVPVRSWTITADAAGRAHLRVTFPSKGSWMVRAMALGTPTNANSAWSPGRRYEVP